MYQDDFKRLTDGAAWVHVAGFILCGFLLLSYAVLPVTATRRAYLNIVLLVGIMILEIGFIVPLARQPEQCFDPVTPHGLTSDRVCAVSGGFVAFGGVFLVTWVLIRALFMHLQICWNITPGNISYWAANIGVLSTSIALTTATLAHTGVSYRFGGYCHVNVGSLSTFWGWLLGFAGVAFLLQLATFAYCIKVYLSSAWSARNDPSNKSASIISSSKSRTARATARRVRDVLKLQWRSLAIVAIAVFTIAFICIVFIVFDDDITVKAFANPDILIPWILCLIQDQDKNKCTGLTRPFIISENLAAATLFILALVGVEAFLLLCRFEFLTAWLTLLRSPFWKMRRNSSTSDILMRQQQSATAKTPEPMPRPVEGTSVDRATERDSGVSDVPRGADGAEKEYHAV